MTDRPAPDRVHYARALRAAGSRGVHTHEMRRAGLTANPAQRRYELECRGFSIDVAHERANDRNGARHTMSHDAGDDAAFLTDAELDAGVGAGPLSASSDPGAGKASARAPVRSAAGRGRQPDDARGGDRIVWMRDYRTPKGYARGWRQLPGDEPLETAA